MTITIRQGETYPSWGFPRLWWKKREFNFVFWFGEDALSMYEPELTSIHKLYGVGWFYPKLNPHHEFSVRVGWAVLGNEISLYAYVYSNSVRSWHYITSVRVNQLCDAQIFFSNSHCCIKINDEEHKFVFFRPKRFPMFRLLPAIGSNKKAKSDIRIQLHEIS